MLLKDYLKRPAQEDYSKPPVWNGINIVPPATILEKEKDLPPVAPSTKENAVDLPKPVWQQSLEVKDGTARSAEQIRENNPQSVSDAYRLPSSDVVERINNGEDVFKILLDNKYNDSKHDIEKQRKAAFLGELANLFGQTIASAHGARQFAPLQSKVPYYNEQLQRLKNQRNDADINYTLSQARSDAENKKYLQKIAMDKYKMDIQQGQFGEQMKLNYAKLTENVRNNLITQEQANKRLEELMRHNIVSEGTASYNARSTRISAQAAQERAKKAGNGRSNSNESIVVSDSNGNRTPVTYSKEKRGAIISLYNRMKKLTVENPGKYGDALENVNLQVGEGGDQASKALTIIQRRLQDFPELTDEFYNIIGKDNGNNVAPWRNTSNNTTTAPWRK